MFYRILKYDVRRGITGNIREYILPAIIAIFMCIGFVFEYSKSFDIHTATYLDIIYYSFAGSPKYVPNKDMPFIFPLVWATIFLLPLYFSSYYPFYDLIGYGKTILLKSGNRDRWWLSKCVWCLLKNTSYFATLYLTILIFCIVTKIPITYKVTGNTHEMMMEKYYKADIYASGDYTQLIFNGNKSILFLLLPILIVTVFSIFQMTVSLFSTPVYGFFVSAMIMVASTYYLHPAFLGNYIMVLRSNQLFSGGVNEATGAIVSLVLITTVTIMNMMLFRKYDILSNAFKNE